MKNVFSSIALVGLLIASTSLFAQSPDSKMINAGVGFSSWGIPIFAAVEIPLKFESQSIVIGASYRTKRETFSYLIGETTWRHTIIGLQGGWNYYFDDLLDMPNEIDLYAGARLNYYIWNTKIEDSLDGFDETYSGGSSGLGLGLAIGGRYHFKKNMSAFAEVGGDNQLSGAKFGLSFKF
ncbi:MAG: hypothetical protein ACJAU0_001398 [Flavobacteriales bacterium]|jgi:outer membrane immunogenic protein